MTADWQLPQTALSWTHWPYLPRSGCCGRRGGGWCSGQKRPAGPASLDPAMDKSSHSGAQAWHVALTSPPDSASSPALCPVSLSIFTKAPAFSPGNELRDTHFSSGSRGAPERPSVDLPIFKLKIPTFHGAGGPGSSSAVEEEHAASGPSGVHSCGFASRPLTSPPREVLFVSDCSL